MAITGISVNDVTSPMNQAPGIDGTIDYTFAADSTDPVSFNIFAVGLDEFGAPTGEIVQVGSVTDLPAIDGENNGTVGIDVDALDPDTDYVFRLVVPDGGAVSGNSELVDILCFADGTLIATDRGEVPIEHLRAGDLVVTMHGGPSMQPIHWIGHTRIAIASQPDQAKVAPILIKAGALANGVPYRDLRVSPEHGMFLNGHLVPARLLVNGTSIVQELWRSEVTYWHVELPAHTLLVAEGAVSESYLDDGNRENFDNYAITTLVKDFERHRANGRYRDNACAPVMDEGAPALASIQARLAGRAEILRDSLRQVA